MPACARCHPVVLPVLFLCFCVSKRGNNYKVVFIDYLLGAFFSNHPCISVCACVHMELRSHNSFYLSL